MKPLVDHIRRRVIEHYGKGTVVEKPKAGRDKPHWRRKHAYAVRVKDVEQGQFSVTKTLVKVTGSNELKDVVSKAVQEHIR